MLLEEALEELEHLLLHLPQELNHVELREASQVLVAALVDAVQEGVDVADALLEAHRHSAQVPQLLFIPQVATNCLVQPLVQVLMDALAGLVVGGRGGAVCVVEV